MSRRARHQDHEEEVENGERWLLTYADMITLLLALFIVLFAISSINQKKFLALALGLKQTFDPKPGVLPSGSGLLANASLTQTAGSHYKSLVPNSLGPTTTTTTVPSSGNVSKAALSALQAQIDNALVKQGLQTDVTLKQQTRGLVVQVLADKVFFATDSASLGSVGNAVVDTVASVLRSDAYNIDVEGYTDNQPILGGAFTSNEELSAVRAVNVVLRLEKVDGIAPDRLSATGYGSSHPVAPNTTPQNMALNRRIDIVVLSSQRSQP